MTQDPHVRVLQRRGGLLHQRLDRRDTDPDPTQILKQPAGLTPRHPRRGQRRRRRRDTRPERSFRNTGRKRRERPVTTHTARPHPPMLTHLHNDTDVAHLMGDRVTISEPVRLTNRRATTTTLRRPIRLDAIRAGNHRPVLAGMTGLPALPAPRTLLLRPLLPGFRRIARRRQRTVARATTDLPLELLYPRHQRQHQIDDRLRIALDRSPELLPPHTARFPATSRNPLRTPDDPLNAYTPASPRRRVRRRRARRSFREKTRPARTDRRSEAAALIPEAARPASCSTA